MAAFLMPRVAFAPAHCAPSRGYHCRPFAPAPAPTPRFTLDPFLSLIEDTVNQIEREARRQQARQQRTFKARFDVREQGEQYLVSGEVPGFEQESIDIEVSDENTLKISGSTERKSEPQPEPEKMVEQPAETTQSSEPTTETHSETHSETSSIKSYQPTVEDDYEDLGAENETISTPSEPKGKEKATEEPKALENAVVPTQQPEAPVQQPTQPEGNTWVSERSYGSFTRTFRFPVRIDAANVRASLKNGVLTVSVPKAPVPQVRRIMIQ